MQTQYSQTFLRACLSVKIRIILFFSQWMPKRIRRNVIKKYLLTISLSGPSGVGKSVIIKGLLALFPQLAFSISATTRAPREGEQDGREYYFLTPEEFQRRITAGEFMEWEEVYPGQFYGTLWCELERLATKGKTVIFDVDVKGGRRIKRIRGEKHLRIFLHAPIHIIELRLRERGTESEQKLLVRIAKAIHELEEMGAETPIVSNVLNDMGAFAINHCSLKIKKFVVVAA